jgi:hypothetical protein
MRLGAGLEGPALNRFFQVTIAVNAALLRLTA